MESQRQRVMARDQFSRLHDDLRRHILSFLLTKDAVATSILSKSWIRLWASVPGLHLDNSHRQRDEEEDLAFIRFADKVISRNISLEILKFRLCYFHSVEPYFNYINRWLGIVMNRNTLEIDLTITAFGESDYADVLEIPVCKTLKVFKIVSDYEIKMPLACFPNLKIFDVMVHAHSSDAIQLLPTLSGAEKIYFYTGVGADYFKLVGNDLKTIELRLYNAMRGDLEDPEIDIEAPKLEYLSVSYSGLAMYPIVNIPSDCRVRLDIGNDEENELGLSVTRHLHVDAHGEGNIYAHRSIILLQLVSHVKTLSLSSCTMRAIRVAIEHDNDLPMFDDLTKLELSLYPRDWSLLLHWLQHAPKLEHLVVTRMAREHDMDDGDFTWIAPDIEPACLLHLKVIKVNVSRAGERNFFNYIRNNAKVLELALSM